LPAVLEIGKLVSIREGKIHAKDGSNRHAAKLAKASGERFSDGDLGCGGPPRRLVNG
jgi:hypothetical protein